MEESEKISQLFAKTQDIELVLLKGHLLIEKKVNNLLRSYTKNPEVFDNVNLRCEQKIRLLYSFHNAPKIVNFGLEELLKLNKLRNKLSHIVDFEQYKEELKDWTQKVSGIPKEKFKKEENFNDAFCAALSMIIGSLTGMTEAVNSFKEK